jgi:cupin fold WbuC family metalloprotein|tara:strand:- start:6 stop:467 length:462 start_codon:yes stop_codon:yes gene_type:complete
MNSSKKILNKLGLKKKNDRVYYSKNTFHKFSLKDIFVLKEITSKNSKLIRICLHKDNKKKIQEMIIMHKTPQIIGPLKQKKESISYHVLNGKLQIDIFNKNEISKFELKKNDSIRIPCNLFRKIISKKKNTIFLEVVNGPFKDKDTIWKDQQK